MQRLSLLRGPPVRTLPWLIVGCMLTGVGASQTTSSPQSRCGSGAVLCVNFSSPLYISRDQSLVVDSEGYVAQVVDPARNIAEYVRRNPLGLYETMVSSSPRAVTLSPAIIASVLVDLRDGALFLPTGTVSPLFSTPTTRDIGYTFLESRAQLLQSSDGSVLVDEKGFLLWRGQDGCSAGQLYIRQDPKGNFQSFEYSIPNGRMTISALPKATDALRILTSSLVTKDGALMQRWSSAHRDVQSSQPESETPAPAAPPAPPAPTPTPPAAEVSGPAAIVPPIPVDSPPPAKSGSP